MGALLPGLVGLAVTAAVFQRELSAWIVSAGLKYFLRDQKASGGVCCRQPTTGGENDEQNASAPRTTITSITFQSISLRFYFRGVEVRLSDGVIVRIGRLSFGFRRLKQMILRQPLQKGKGKAIVLTVENASVSLPASLLEPSVASKESARPGKSSINPNLEEGRTQKKPMRLPAAALLCARFVAMEVCDLRVELAASDQAGTCGTRPVGSEHKGDGNGDDPLKDGGCARKAAGAHAATGVRAIEVAGMRLVGFVSKRSSCLTVRGLI